MFKKILLAILIALPMSVVAQTVKIGVIDLQTLIQESPETAEVQKQLQDAQAKYQGDLQKLHDEFQKAYDEYSKLKSDASTPAAILERHEKTLGEMQQRIQQNTQTYDQDLQQQQYQLMSPIIDKVQKAAQTVGQEQGLTIIIPTEAAIYMSADVVDVNPLVKTKLGIK